MDSDTVCFKHCVAFNLNVDILKSIRWSGIDSWGGVNSQLIRI